MKSLDETAKMLETRDTIVWRLRNCGLAVAAKARGKKTIANRGMRFDVHAKRTAFMRFGKLIATACRSGAVTDRAKGSAETGTPRTPSVKENYRSTQGR